MDWQIGCFTLPWSEFPLDRALEGIKSAGYEFVGLGTKHEGVDMPSVAEGRGAAQEVKVKLDAIGLVPLVLFAGWQGDSGLEDFRTRIDQAALLDIPFVLTAGTWTGMDGSVSEEDAANAEAQFLARMSQILPYAGEHGITVLLKPHTGNTAHGPLLRTTLNKIGSQWVQACYDPGNVHFYEGLSPEVDILHVLPYLKAMCIKDHKGTRGEANFPIPGGGDVNFRRIFRHMRRSQFAGPLVVERFDGTDPKSTISAEEADSRAARSLEFLQKIVGEIAESSR
ncbi:MAG: sugar phosphate isomerase/epimerase [Candidatus Latescibacteria bacterium]|jgi:sugar phosphate isomerase/epimerase|nr:sugar phosphate isomerase/epimerase [Candidatus Latescibacterota bacterium]